MTTESLSVTIEGEVLTVEIGTVAVAPGGGSGDVVGPASATDDRIAAFDGVTGKLIKQGSVTATAVASHLGSTSNPHSVTAAQVGADATGTAAAAVVAHAGATDPHGDRAFATSAVSTHAALTTGVHGLGGASQLNVGTTAGTVAAGDHAHAGVYQPLATVLTNTTAAFTTAQETKLAGIEALADVTDAGNVGSAIDGATAKTTPVDADAVPLIDSAASNVLKKLSWANLKATVKTYFDTLYQAILVSGSNIKTINGVSPLGSGDIAISASPGGSSGQGQYNSAGAFAGMPLWVADANTIWQRNSTTAQTHYLAGTYTDASNYEALSLSYSDGAFEVAPVAAGTGTYRNLRLGRRNNSTTGYIEVVPESYGCDIKAYYGNGNAANIRFTESFSCNASKDINISGVASFGKNGFHFDGRAGYNVDISFRENWGYDVAVGSLNIAGCGQYSANTTNLVGGIVTITGGKGASASAGLATGGGVYLDGGQGYGTGADGNVLVGNTRGKLQLKSYAVASLGAATPAGMRAFANDANATTFHSVVAGGGANFVPVFSDGTNWRIG